MTITIIPGTNLEVTMSAWEASLEMEMRGDVLLKRPFDEDEEDLDGGFDLDDEDEDLDDDEESDDEEDEDFDDEDEEDFDAFGFDEDDPDA